MVPRLHARGTSFKGASAYLFHDKNRAETSERVAWAEVVNCWSEHPADAWFEMWDTWKERHALKRVAGVPAGGRDNRNPVLHFSLSWHPDERPGEQDMKAAAREALQILGLADHQAVILSHNDEPHPHVHVLVNTVHRHTGQTAKLSYSKEALSRWAEGLERADGVIRCEERVVNNERRRRIKQERAAEKTHENFNRAARKPYEPVKHRGPTRRQWFDRQEIIDRLKALRADQKAEHGVERDELWSQQTRQREAIETAARASVDQVRRQLADRNRPAWKTLYRAQKAEARELGRADHLFERAVYVYRHRERLAPDGAPMTVRDMATLILSEQRLKDRLETIHERDRRGLAAHLRVEQRQATDEIWTSARERLNNLRARHAAERAALRSHQAQERADITFATAKESLAKDEPRQPARDFGKAVSPPPSPAPERRSERAKRQAEEWRRRNRGRDDFDRER